MINVKDNELRIIKDIIGEYAADCKVYAFGSRVKNTQKRFSDLDLFFDAEKKMGFLRIQKIKEAFQESDLPYRVDVVDYNDISEKFREITSGEKEIIYGK
jgi:type I restriction enzyme S subunit